MSEIRLELQSRWPHGRDDEHLGLGRVWIDGREGELVYVGREPHVEGPDGLVPLPREAYGVALVEALDRIAGAVWGDDWSSAVAELSGMNRRSTARDRVRKQGLPPRVLLAVVTLAERPDAREMSGIVRAAARYIDVHHTPGQRALDHARDMLSLCRGLGAVDENWR